MTYQEIIKTIDVLYHEIDMFKNNQFDTYKKFLSINGFIKFPLAIIVDSPDLYKTYAESFLSRFILIRLESNFNLDEKVKVLYSDIYLDEINTYQEYESKIIRRRF